jgi:hypothetical protein
MVKSLMSPPMSNNLVCENIKNCFVLPDLLQTSNLYNFKDNFEYSIDFCNKYNKKIIQNDDIFQMDEDTTNNEDEYEEDEGILNRDYLQYLGNGILNNIYKAELVDSKWILYSFIISKIHKSFKTNILNQDLKIHSFHIGYDNGSVQSALNHLFKASKLFNEINVHWKWVTISRNNELYKKYKLNFIPILSSKVYWEQSVFICNKAAEMLDRYNLIIFQINDISDLNPIKMRKQYLFTIIMALRFLDAQGVLLMEFPNEKKWGLLEINILGLCGLLFDAVYFTKYEIGQEYCVLICRDKKKNLSTTALLKKLIKILNESDTLCIINKELLNEEFISQIKYLQNNPLIPILFEQIIEEITELLEVNEFPIC